MARITLDAETFKALASATRLTVLRSLDQRRKTLSELARDLELNKATLHEHLQLLSAAGLVRKRDDEGRKWIYYELTWTGQKLLHPQETTTFSVLLGFGVAAAGGGVGMLLYALNSWAAQRSGGPAPETPAVLGDTKLRGDTKDMAAPRSQFVGEATGMQSAGASDAAPSTGQPSGPPGGTPAPSPAGGSGGGQPGPAGASPAPSGTAQPTAQPAQPTGTAAPNAPPATSEAPEGSGPYTAPDAAGGSFNLDHSANDGASLLVAEGDGQAQAVAAEPEPDFMGEGGWVALALLMCTLLFTFLALRLKRKVRPKPFDPRAAAEAATAGNDVRPDGDGPARL